MYKNRRTFVLHLLDYKCETHSVVPGYFPYKTTAILSTLYSFGANARRHLSFICKVDRLDVKQRRSIQTRRVIELIKPSHLDLCCLHKPIIIACGSE